MSSVVKIHNYYSNVFSNFLQNRSRLGSSSSSFGGGGGCGEVSSLREKMLFDVDDAVGEDLVYRADNIDDRQAISDHFSAVVVLRYSWGGLTLGMVELSLAQQDLAEHQALSVHETDPWQGREVHAATKQHPPLRPPAVNVEVTLHYFIDALHGAAVK